MSDDAKKLDESLQRVARAMTALSTQPPGRAPAPAPPVPLTRTPAWFWARFWTFGSLATALFAGHYGHHTASQIAMASALAGLGALVLTRARHGLRQATPDRPHIGMGASVGRGARVHPGATVEMGADIGRDVAIEEGAVVEMGASIGRGAVLEKGAVVKMGASVGRGAVLEEGAVVAWGASVKRGARVGAGARVGTGATVGRDAKVPPGAWVMAGGSFQDGNAADADDDSDPEDSREARGAEANARLRDQLLGRAPGAPEPVSRQDMPSMPAPAAPAIDPREEKFAAVFGRIDRELAASPGQLREHLGASARGVASLRQTCTQLGERERALRAESSPESLARLDAERAALAERIAKADDEAVKLSLASAVAAIDEQKRQRQLLGKSAERLDAELTRLYWTLDGLAAQLLRMRTAGAEASRLPDAELTRSVQQLQSEIDAIADALEQVARDDRAPASAAATSAQPLDPNLASAPDEDGATAEARKKEHA